MASTITRKLLTEGQAIAFQAGRVVIRLQCARLNAAYTVVVEQGTHRIDDNCTSVDSEAQARQIARMYAELYLLEA